MNLWDTDPRLGRYALRDPFNPLLPDMEPTAPSPLAQAPVAQTSGMTTEPAVPQGGLLDGMGGLLGAYGGLVNPYAQTPQDKLFAGVRQLGRAALSGFMAPSQAGEYIQQARVADAVQGRALQQQRALTLDEEKKERLRQALLRIDPRDPQRNEKAFQALYAVDPEAALEFQKSLGKDVNDVVKVTGPDGTPRWALKSDAIGMQAGEKEPPVSRRRNVGGVEVFEEWNPQTGAFERVSEAPRWRQGAGGGGGGGVSAEDGSAVDVGEDGQPLDAWSTPPLRSGDKQAAIAARTMGRQLEQDSKEFIGLQSAQRQLDELEKANSPAAEIATLYQFIKQLDPTSVVREGEVALSREGMSYFDRLGLAYKRVGEGGVVTPGMKKDLISTARKLYRAQIPAQIDREKRAFNVGAQLRVPPSALGGSRLTQSDWDIAFGKGQAPEAAVPDTKVVNGVTYRRVPGGWQRQ